MALVSPSSGLLIVAYSVALVSVLSAFGISLLDERAASGAITGAYFTSRSCDSTGDLRCIGAEGNYADNTITMTFENLRDEPVIISSTRLGTCQPTLTDIRVEIGGVIALGAEPCFALENYPGRLPFEIYVTGIWTGLTSTVPGTIQQ
jgi:hypothetical protein